MHTIAIKEGTTAEVDLQLDDQSEAAQLGLAALKAKATGFFGAADKPLDQAGLKSCLFGPGFLSPSFGLGDGLTLNVHASTEAAFAVFTKKDGALFESDGVSPEVAVGEDDCWVRFGLNAGLDVALGATAPSGFGVSGESNQGVNFATYTRLQREGTSFPTLKEGAQAALARFHLPRNAQVLRNQPADSIYTWEVSGSFTVAGSYTLPLAVNGLTLATAKLPLNREIAVVPEAVLGVSGALQISGMFEGRSYRPDANVLQLGLYKKKETDFTATLLAEAGVGATVGSTDLLSALFNALPGADLKAADLDAGDAEQMQAALRGAVQQGLSIAVNTCCSASVSDEAAVLYEIDLTKNTSATDEALAAALRGNWRPLGALANARELRNLVKETHTARYSATLHLLGLYDAVSLREFLRSSRILHNREDGSVTVTDKATAEELSGSVMAVEAKDDRLRQALQQSFIATAVYSASTTTDKLHAELEAKLTSLVYKEQTSAEEIKKNLLLAVTLGLSSPAEVETLAGAKSFHYARFAASADFKGNDALQLFFSDSATRTPRRLEDVTKTGRDVLASLLDRSVPVDEARWQILKSDQAWSQMDAQQFPKNSPASYSDWYDVTFWATAIAKVGPVLKSVLDRVDQFTGPDPTRDPQFMARRDELAKALEGVAKNLKTAFEKGWPIAVSCALAGRSAPVRFAAFWNGKEMLTKGAPDTLSAAAAALNRA